MLKPLLLLFFCIGGYWLTAQDLLLSATESLRNNVVRISVRFQDGNLQHGFGFITGEKNGMLYLATAAHVIHGESFDQQPSQIQVWFYSDLLVYTAKEVSFFEAYDLAILQLNKPSNVAYQQENWANFSLQNNQSVRFIGRDRDWLIPAQGEIHKFDNERIYAYMPTVHPGTSGAPLVSEKGIVGLIIEDDNSEVTAITMSKVKELFTQGGRFPYFNINQNLTTSDVDLKIYEMVKVEGGKYIMGCTESRDQFCQDYEKPHHEVNINSFFIGKYEVTNEEFAKFLNTICNQINVDTTLNIVSYQGKDIFKLYCVPKKVDCFDFREQIKYLSKGQSGGCFSVVPGYEKYPVVMVSKYGAEAYCHWVSSLTGKNYRLPTEAEWEYAARGGKFSKNYIYAGFNNLIEIGWYWDNSGEVSHPIGQKKANELGIFDMSGNVAEWCNDWFDEEFYKISPKEDPKGSLSGSNTIFRGGSFVDSYHFCRVAARIGGKPEYCIYFVGFRLGRDS